MTFVPLPRQTAHTLHDTGALVDENVVGFAATASLMAAHCYDQTMTEDGDFAALVYAGAQALVASSSAEVLRLVLAVDLAPEQAPAVEDDPYGRVSLRQLRWADVVALFSDEPEAAGAVISARTAASSATLAEALDLPQVELLLDEHDLLWFAPEELDQLPE